MKQFIGMMIVITAVCCLAFCEPKTITNHVESEKRIIKKHDTKPNIQKRDHNDHETFSF